MDHYAVFGHPVVHSLSPKIHALFANQYHQQMAYSAIEAPLDGFAQALQQFRQQGGQGANVTVPFKLEAYALVDSASELAQRAQAVNTLYWQQEQLVGDNTDGLGLIADLTQHLQLSLRDKRVLVLGAGGAVRGVLAPLLAEQPASIHIANRTESKVHALLSAFADLGPVYYQPPEPTNQPFDLVINGTSSSLSADLPFCDTSWLQPDMLGYDMMYGAQPTRFMQWLQAQGVSWLSDGLGMLVEQAACAFYRWRGVQPEGAPVLQAVRRSLSDSICNK